MRRGGAAGTAAGSCLWVMWCSQAVSIDALWCAGHMGECGVVHAWGLHVAAGCALRLL